MMTLVSGELRSPLVQVQRFVITVSENLLQRRSYGETIASKTDKRREMVMLKGSLVGKVVLLL